ncbi:MAG: extracellular solute-binding protein, partial [Clostridia bacterium]|nr:extracellular solute-binding protein [Clostridia bacterium]
MQKRLLSIFLIISVILLSLSLFSCGNNSSDATQVALSVEEMEMPEYKAGQTVTLNVYNWGEYISDGSEDSFDTNKEFENYFNSTLSEKYGGIKIKVEYSTYPTNEDMYSKLTNSAVSYDVITPSDYMIEKMISEGLLYSFDTSSLSNYVNIPEEFRGTYYDPDNKFSVPYTYGMLGVIYNKEGVDKEDVEKKSWELLWNPKYAGNILQFNNPRDAFATAMYYAGLDVNSDDP